MLITSKKQYYSMLSSGYFFGNNLSTWHNIPSFISDDNDHKLFAFRHRTKAKDLTRRLKLYPFRKKLVLSLVESNKISLREFYISEFLNPMVVKIQGEITLCKYGFHAHFSRNNKILPEALREREAFFITDGKFDKKATRLIKSVSDTPTWEFINFAFDEYSRRESSFSPCSCTSPILEITFTNEPVGEYGWYSIQWEWRHY